MRSNQAAYDHDRLVHTPPISSPRPRYVQAVDSSQRGIDANPPERG
jgi:hypothetical protein